MPQEKINVDRSEDQLFKAASFSPFSMPRDRSFQFRRGKYIASRRDRQECELFSPLLSPLTVVACQLGMDDGDVIDGQIFQVRMDFFAAPLLAQSLLSIPARRELGGSKSPMYSYDLDCDNTTTFLLTQLEIAQPKATIRHSFNTRVFPYRTGFCFELFIIAHRC